MAAEEKPRIFQGGKDMLLSLGVTVVGMLLVVGGTGLCTISPEDSPRGAIQEVDAQNFLEMEARATNTTIRSPETPAGWTPNSARRANVANAPASVVGWVTDNEGFVQAFQTNVELEDAISGFDQNYREDSRVVQVGDKEVSVRTSTEKNVRDLWALDLGDTRLLLTGSAPDEDYETIIEAFLQADEIDPEKPLAEVSEANQGAEPEHSGDEH